ncbi:hypothetical protein TSUD_320360 [Trifolium subterraneum]|uniref:Uncharacterized protein n=1 Tax=Trifolium subterraneum TaxID=3900 RepID=A0A2Z6N1W1_TRISU|nr:hypothetical protein TSUD_320360 [Trifolium subterraneum]
MSKNEIVLQLLDSYFNPVILQQSRLNLEITSVNSSRFLTWDTMDNKDGSYICSYMAKDFGTMRFVLLLMENIYVLNIPPQFASVPSKLQATEDLISPRFSKIYKIKQPK